MNQTFLNFILLGSDRYAASSRHLRNSSGHPAPLTTTFSNPACSPLSLPSHGNFVWSDVSRSQPIYLNLNSQNCLKNPISGTFGARKIQVIKKEWEAVRCLSDLKSYVPIFLFLCSWHEVHTVTPVELVFLSAKITTCLFLLDTK